MTITLNLPPDIEASLLAQATAQGLELSEYVQHLVYNQVGAHLDVVKPPLLAHELPAEEWIRRFKEWAESAAHANLPVLSDEAMSREFIYAERGL